MTYRERREQRAENYRTWAAKRTEAANRQLTSQPELRHDWAFITQPGHIPARSRMIAADDRAMASIAKAESMTSRAANIEDGLAGSIFDDDPDAIDALRARIADLEAKREAIKAHNKAMRRPGACDHAADCDCRSAYPRECACTKHPYPAYHLQNLNGNLSRQRDRLARLERQAARSEKAESAGGVAVERLAGGYVAVTFAEKPAAEIRETLKAAGFRWAKGSWVGAADRLPDGLAG